MALRFDLPVISIYQGWISISKVDKMWLDNTHRTIALECIIEMTLQRGTLPWSSHVFCYLKALVSTSTVCTSGKVRRRSCEASCPWPEQCSSLSVNSLDKWLDSGKPLSFCSCKSQSAFIFRLVPRQPHGWQTATGVPERVSHSFMWEWNGM